MGKRERNAKRLEIALENLQRNQQRAKPLPQALAAAVQMTHIVDWHIKNKPITGRYVHGEGVPTNR